MGNISLFDQRMTETVTIENYWGSFIGFGINNRLMLFNDFHDLKCYSCSKDIQTGDTKKNIRFDWKPRLILKYVTIFSRRNIWYLSLYWCRCYLLIIQSRPVEANCSRKWSSRRNSTIIVRDHYFMHVQININEYMIYYISDDQFYIIR